MTYFENWMRFENDEVDDDEEFGPYDEMEEEGRLFF